jgi:hypothetical protein
MSTIENLVEQHGVNVLEHHDQGKRVRATKGEQRFGEIMVTPADPVVGGFVVPDSGVSVRGERGGVAYRLFGDGPIVWASAPADSGDYGYLTVPAATTARVAHPEHTFALINPGTYVIRPVPPKE